jgi:hypothetical protein
LELADDRLENIFGNMRQQCRSMKNFDVIQLSERINKHEPKVKMENGELILKSYALRLKFAANKKATDRVRKSMGMAKSRSDPSHPLSKHS